MDKLVKGDKFVKRCDAYTEYMIYGGDGNLHTDGLADRWGKGWESKVSDGFFRNFIGQPGVEYVGNIYRKAR